MTKLRFTFTCEAGFGFFRRQIRKVRLCAFGREERGFTSCAAENYPFRCWPHHNNKTKPWTSGTSLSKSELRFKLTLCPTGGRNTRRSRPLTQQVSVRTHTAHTAPRPSVSSARALSLTLTWLGGLGGLILLGLAHCKSVDYLRCLRPKRQSGANRASAGLATWALALVLAVFLAAALDDARWVLDPIHRDLQGDWV